MALAPSDTARSAAPDATTSPLTGPVAVFMREARQQWQTANEAESDNRKEALEDLKFLNLDQWPANTKALRSAPGQERPCLTIDQIGPPVRQLVNTQRQAHVSLRILPAHGGASKDTAEMLQGLIRAIEYQSDAQTAYEQAFSSAAGPGWGYVRLRAEYESPESFDQVIRIEGIENPLSVYCDPATRTPDRRDMRFAFITQDLTWAEYRERYGASQLAQNGQPPSKIRAGSADLFQGIGDEAQNWFPDGHVRIAEYYYLKDTLRTRVQLADGQTAWEDELPPDLPPDQVLQSRPVRLPVVYWSLINGIEILDGNADRTAGREIPGTTIPLRFCYGEALNVNGKRTYRGIVRPARDPQRMYNYQNSSLVEDLALAPRTPIVGAAGQFENFEGKWDQINTRAFSYVEYNPIAVSGVMAPPPTRPPGPDPAKIQAVVAAINQAKADLRSTTGWYDTTDPTRRNADQSGKAIALRQTAQQEAGAGFFDNFRKMMVSLGKLLVEWIPVIYDRPGRILQILSDENEPGLIMTGQPFIQSPQGVPQPAPPEMQGLAKIFQPGLGHYDVRVTIGNSYLTRRQEAAETMGNLLEHAPGLMGVFGDLYFRNLDIPESTQIAERVARTIPPQIRGDDPATMNLPPEIRQLLGARDQMIQKLQAQVSQLQHDVEIDAAKQRATIQTQQLKAQTDLKLKQLDVASDRAETLVNARLEDKKLRTQQAIAQLNAEVALLKTKADLLKVQATLNTDQTELAIQAENQRLDALLQTIGAMEPTGIDYAQPPEIDPASQIPEPGEPGEPTEPPEPPEPPEGGPMPSPA